jgi:hypothetical protein
MLAIRERPVVAGKLGMRAAGDGRASDLGGDEDAVAPHDG